MGVSAYEGHAFLMLQETTSLDFSLSFFCDAQRDFQRMINIPCIGTLSDCFGDDAKGKIVW